MKKWFLILIGVVLWPGEGRADLLKYAHDVPTAAIDQIVHPLIVNETNDDGRDVVSHYTLAEFKETASGDVWYILDGYYELKSGRVLFLDFLYDPSTKLARPIANYRNFLPGNISRYLLEAKKICDPYDRHFIGLLRGKMTDRTGFIIVQNYFDTAKRRQPIFIVNDEDLLIVDFPKSASGWSDVLFTMDENSVARDLKTEANVVLTTIQSGRAPSDANVVKTYTGVTASCRQ